METRTEILNKIWKVKDLQLIASTKVVKDLLSDYQKDKNCRPYDFVAGEKISDLEKASFIYTALNSQTISSEEIIGKYLIKSTGTDIETVGKIIAAKNNTVTLHPVEHKLVSKMEFHIGGFMANCSNNDDQEYSFKVDETNEYELTITKSMLKNQYSFSDVPRHFYDYNF